MKTALFFSVSSILLIFSDSSEKAQRIEIAKIHLPDGFTWKILNEQKIKDAAILELKTDAQFTPKVTQSKRDLRDNLSYFRSYPFACLLFLEAALPKITTTRLEFEFCALESPLSSKAGSKNSLVGEKATIWGWGQVSPYESTQYGAR